MSGGSKLIKENVKERNKYLNNAGINLDTLEIMAKHYSLKAPSKMPYSKDLLIPKIIHQIWIGSKDIPPLYKNYTEECRLLHPNWEFKLWKDEDIAKLNMQYKNIYDLARSLVQRSDILRYEILLRFGGVYRDMDVKCYRPLDEMNHKYDFYAALEYVGVINNGFIASAPNHPIIKETLDQINNNLPLEFIKYDNGELYFASFHNFIVKTSMIPLTEAFKKISNFNDKAIAIPTTYFFGTINGDLVSWTNSVTPIPNNIFNLIKAALGNPQPHKLAFARVPKEALVFHNYASKSEIGYLPFNEGMDIYDVERGQAFQKLPLIEQHRLNMMRENYEKFHTKNIGEIPQKIIFIVFNEEEKKELDLNIPEWVMLNRTFEIYIWTKDKILKSFPYLAAYFDNTNYNNEDIRFLAGLEIINKEGGHYIDFKAKPIVPIFELGNKLKLYTGIQPVNHQNLQILASNRLIGAVANSPILSQALDKFYKKNTSMRWNLIDIISKKMFLYGPILVLPSSYVGPTDYLPEDTYITKLKRIYRYHRSTINDKHAYYSIID
ncbi:glycosyltransferase [Rickettsia endosymbiont of Polydrusus tereticollis]|uniref:glycosyltransferase n=1 Tax=Rickettsia endosymbiont of Polydrusus tereticollis TaxID=3066251 RepID=UPI003132BC48